MDARTLADSKIYISATNAAPATYDATGYAALTWTQAKGIITFPDITDSQEDVTYAPIDEPVTQHAKGTTTYDGMDFEFANIPTDAGQLLFAAAKADDAEWHVKLELSSGEIVYRSGLVSQNTLTGGTVNDIAMKTYTLLPNHHVYVAAP